MRLKTLRGVRASLTYERIEGSNMDGLFVYLLFNFGKFPRNRFFMMLKVKRMSDIDDGFQSSNCRKDVLLSRDRIRRLLRPNR